MAKIEENVTSTHDPYIVAVFCRSLYMDDLSSGESVATPVAKARQGNGRHLSDCPCFSKRQYVALLTQD